MSIASKKHKLISSILSNETYTESSGIWSRLYNTLSKLSLDDLEGLQIIIRLKEQYAANNPAKWTD